MGQDAEEDRDGDDDGFVRGRSERLEGQQGEHQRGEPPPANQPTNGTVRVPSPAARGMRAWPAPSAPSNPGAAVAPASGSGDCRLRRSCPFGTPLPMAPLTISLLFAEFLYYSLTLA